MKKSYQSTISQHIKNCNSLNWNNSKLAFLIMHSAEDYEDDEVMSTLSNLSDELKSEIYKKLSKFKETGQYYVISSTGTSLDLSSLMNRLDQLLS